MKLKNDKTCYRHDGSEITTTCRFGYCVIKRCSYCGLEAGAEWGPIACPHKKNENGTLRWYKYPDMDVKTPVSIKRSALMRKQSRKQ
jgi:hypothetical protein